MFYQGLLLLYILVLVESASLRQGLIHPEVCETNECHSAADQIKKWMNPAFQPCEDFYEFSCGYWHSPNDTITNKVHTIASLGSRGDLFSVQMKKFLLDDSTDKESDMFQMVKNFMRMCLDEEAIEARGLSPAIDFMRRAGGWPVLEKNWSEEGWDLLKTDLLLGGAFLKYDVLPVQADFTYTLVISPKYLDESYYAELSEGMESEPVQKYYKSKCKLAEEFGAEKGKAEQDMKEVLEFEIAMSKLGMAMNDSEGYLEGNITEVQDYITWVNWTQLLNTILPDSVKFTQNDTLFVVIPEYLSDLEDLINSYPKRTLANYIFSKSASSMKKYLSKSFSNGEEEVTRSRFDTCINIMKTSSLAGIFASYVARHTFEDTKTAKEMTQNILKELTIDLKGLAWLDEKTRSVAIQSVQDTTLQIGFPDELLNLDTVENLYKEVKVNSTYFFEAAMDSDKWVQKQQLRNVGKPIKEDSLQNQIEAAMTINAYFMLRANRIVVTPGFMHYLPLFSSKVPAYVNYGNLGGFIAHELTHALDFQADNQKTYYHRKIPPANRIFDLVMPEDRQLLYKWGSNDTEELYEQKKQCVIDQYSSFKESRFTGNNLNGNETQREDVADNGGLKLAFNAYKRMASKLPAPEQKLPKLQQYSDEQLFMVSVANAYCEIPMRARIVRQLLSDVHSPSQFRVTGMMMNSADFSKLFGCKKGDPMDPVKKCEVW